MILHLDTSFLVDLLRERARGVEGAASAFLARHLEDELCASVFVACELLLGVGLRIMNVRTIAVGDLLPALIVAPLLTVLVGTLLGTA